MRNRRMFRVLGLMLLAFHLPFADNEYQTLTKKSEAWQLAAFGQFPCAVEKFALAANTIGPA